jgi:hypothetical protein
MTLETQVAAGTDTSAAATTAPVAGIHANFDPRVEFKEMKFHFKKTKDEASGEEFKRPTVELKLPVPSVNGVIAILEKGGKELDLLLDSLQEVVAARARTLVNEKEDINQDNFPLDQISWEAIANLPKAERRGGGISKEVWEQFAADYINVMPGITGKDKEKIGNAAKIMLAKFNPVKTNKPVLKLLKEQIALYLTSSPNAEEYAECVEFLMNKADNLINLDDAALLSNL